MFSLYSLIAAQADIDALAERYRAGGMGYGEAKKLLLEAIETKFAPIRERREHFVSNPDLVDKILRDGAEKARPLARATLDRARRACGVG